MNAQNTLAERALAGDDGAWRELYAQLRPQIRRQCRRMLVGLPGHDPDGVEALVRAEAWIALTKWDPARGAANTIVVRSVWSRLKHAWTTQTRAKRHPAAPHLRATEGHDPAESVADPAAMAPFEAAVARAEIDARLDELRLGAPARRFAGLVLDNPGESIAALARAEGISTQRAYQHLAAIDAAARRGA